MEIINKLYNWYGKRNVRIVFAVLFILILVVLITGKDAVPDAQESSKIPLVSVAPVAELDAQQYVQLTGTVRAVNEATIESEVGGRVTAVSGDLGAQVFTGQVIATLENTTQYATLLQAEGVYEAALASAEASEIGVDEANNALNAILQNSLSIYQSAYTTLNNLHFAQLDTIYADPKNTYRTSGFYPSDFTSTEGAVDVLYAQITANLRAQATQNVTEENIDDALVSALLDTQLLVDVTTLLRSLINESDADTTLDPEEVAYLATLSVVEDQLFRVKSNLQSVQANLTAAKETQKKAALGSQNANISSANAQVKQALGALKLAQANYEKTILRTPITGVVETLNVQKGDFISAFQTIARIKGDGALEITAFVGDADRDALNVGDAVVLSEKITGVITHIAPSLDPQTKKTEIRIGSDAVDLINGDTVRVRILKQNRNETEVVIPLAAIKLTADEAFVFMVTDGVLVAQNVTLGEIRGTNTVVTAGLNASDVIVTDVRGFAVGQAVEIK